MIAVHSSFDGGNILVLEASDPSAIRLEIVPDAHSHYFQWFSFRIIGARGQYCRFIIENAGKSSYPAGWPGYRVAASYDREDWFRIDTTYAEGQLAFSLTPVLDCVYLAYFAPFSLERNAGLVTRTLSAGRSLPEGELRLIVAGETLDGRPLDLLTWRSLKRDLCPQIWIIARQHPGETMASWWMEGFLARLFDRDDPLARHLRASADFHIVPLMNPDGAFRGHLRTNAAGVDLNRQWAEPDPARAPEVFHIRNAMDEAGLDFFLDVHGDEGLPWNFIAGAEGVPGFSPGEQSLLDHYKQALARACPDFQTVHGYPVDAPGAANPAIATNQIALRFRKLAMTLEMPFKDNAGRPDPERGFSPARAGHLGRASLDAIADWLIRYQANPSAPTG